MTAPAARARASRLAAVTAGVWVGVTAWLSLGALAVVEADRVTRVGALPSYAWLAALVAAGVALGAVAGPSLRLASLALLALPWLPWLPLPVPAAFLLWEGPLEGAVWLVALAGAAWPAVAASVPDAGALAAWWRAPRRAPWVAAALFAALALGGWSLARPRLPAGDEPHYLVITQSLLRDGDLRIENNHRDEDYLAYHDAVLKPDFMRRGTDGQIYSIHAPGVAALVLPAFAAGGYAAAVLVIILVGALGVAALWRIAWRLTESAGAAWVAVGAISTAAPFALHAYTVYPDPVGGVLALVGVGALVALDVHRGRLTGMTWLGVGAALAVLPWLHTRFALIAGVLGAAILLRLWRRERGGVDSAWFLALPAASAAAWFAYFWTIYGTVNPAAPYGTRPEGGLAFIPSGLTGLLIDQQFGLLATAPVLAAALVGLMALGRARPRLAVEMLAVLVPYLVIAASYPMWWGGYSAPARFAVVLVPMLGLPLAVLWARGARATRAAIATLTVLSAAVTLALLAVDRGALIYNGRDGHSLLLDWLSRSTDLTLALPSVHRDGMALALADAAIWLVASVGMGAAALLVTRLVPRLAGVTMTLTLPAVVILASTIVWDGQRRPAVTPSTSQMSWLARTSPERQPHVLQLTPTRWLALDDAPRRLNIASSVRGRRSGPVDELLRLPEVPAGDYDLFVDSAQPPAGTVTVRLGRQTVPMEQWRLDGRPSGYTGLVLRLPVEAHSIAVSGDAAAVASGQRLSLRPRQRLGAASSRWARASARYGPVVVYALDDQAYLESSAIWIKGERTAEFVVRADAVAHAGAMLRLAAGPVPNEIVLGAGAWRRTVALAAGAAIDVPVPADALAPAILTITSRTGFRPTDHGGGPDGRSLGVFVTWSGQTAAAGDEQ